MRTFSSKILSVNLPYRSTFQFHLAVYSIGHWPPHKKRCYSPKRQSSHPSGFENSQIVLLNQTLLTICSARTCAILLSIFAVSSSKRWRQDEHLKSYHWPFSDLDLANSYYTFLGCASGPNSKQSLFAFSLKSQTRGLRNEVQAKCDRYVQLHKMHHQLISKYSRRNVFIFCRPNYHG